MSRDSISLILTTIAFWNSRVSGNGRGLDSLLIIGGSELRLLTGTGCSLKLLTGTIGGSELGLITGSIVSGGLSKIGGS